MMTLFLRGLDVKNLDKLSCLLSLLLSYYLYYLIAVIKGCIFSFRSMHEHFQVQRLPNKYYNKN